MAKNEWVDWLKCNVLEIIILILVLVLLVKGFSAPAVQEVNKSLTIEEPPAASGEIPAAEVPAEGAVTAAPIEETPTG